MFDFETTLSGIDYKIRRLAEERNHLQEQVMELNEKNEELIEQNQHKEQIINQLKDQVKILKLRNSLADNGDPVDIKLKINQLIRNIDKSIALLTKVD